jgi:hypothetical protein
MVVLPLPVCGTHQLTILFKPPSSQLTTHNNNNQVRETTNEISVLPFVGLFIIRTTRSYQFKLLEVNQAAFEQTSCPAARVNRYYPVSLPANHFVGIVSLK